MKKLGIALRHGLWFIGIVASLYAMTEFIHLSNFNESINGIFRVEVKKLKTIFLWNPKACPGDLFSDEQEKNSLAFLKIPGGIFPYKPPPCPVTCRYTTKPEFLRTADVVVFNKFNLGFYSNQSSLEPSRRFLAPDKRPAKQLYIFFRMEPPSTYYELPLAEHPIPKRFFNYTMSYRGDSSIYVPYYEVVRTRRERRNYFPDMFKKTKFATWMVSNCYAGSRRHKLVQRLRSYVQVDIYGECSKIYPPCGTASDEECFRILGKTHKFYLSFENSLCEDYVTEKFFYALKSDMIPIVYGQANYSRLVPSKSFIDVRDFPSVQDLAMYLKRLDENDTEYLEYFNWKKDGEVSAASGWEDPYCVLCQKLISGDLTRNSSVIEDVVAWWYTAKDGRSPACKDPSPTQSF